MQIGQTPRDKAIEIAAQAIYEAKGDRIGKDYIGWDKERDEVKDDWRVDVRATICAYEDALASNSKGHARVSSVANVRKGGPTEAEPDRPCCKPDGSCCDFVCGN